MSTHSLQQALLPTIHTLLIYTNRIRVVTARSSLSKAPAPKPALQHIQKAWDAPIVSNLSQLVFASAAYEINLARLKAASSPHSGDWLHAPTIASNGLLLTKTLASQWQSDLGVEACSPYTCVCDKPVDAGGFHALSCRRPMA